MKPAWAMIIAAVSIPPATSRKEFLRGLRHKALTNALKQGRAVKLQEMKMGSAKDACNEENRRVLAWRMIDDAVALPQSIKRRDIEEGVRRAALDQALKRTNKS
jgi:formiminotetrahydrofolate cyclodeaminase